MAPDVGVFGPAGFCSEVFLGERLFFPWVQFGEFLD